MDTINLKEKYFRKSLPGDVSNSLYQLANGIVLHNMSEGDGENINRGKSPKIILLTSSLHREGTTFIALHLAKTLSKTDNKSVLLIDMNFRSSFFSRFAESDTPVVKDCFTADKEVDFRQTVRKTDIDNLYIAPAMKKGDKLAPGFNGDKIKTILNDGLKKDYDFIIIDSAPLNNYPDSLFIAPYVDGTILVIQAHKTRRQIVEKVRLNLEKRNANLLGAIINRRKHFIPRFIYKRL